MTNQCNDKSNPILMEGRRTPVAFGQPEPEEWAGHPFSKFKKEGELPS